MPKKQKLPAADVQLFEVAPSEEAAPASSPAKGARSAAQFVDEMMYLLTAPYMFYPPWDDVWTPENKNRALIYRLAHAMEIFRTEQATEYETMLYISTATLAGPPSHDWFQIYMWLFSRWKPELAKELELLPGRPELNITQTEDLTQLRRWIFRSQMNHLKSKTKGADRAEVEKEVKEPEASQPQLF